MGVEPGACSQANGGCGHSIGVTNWQQTRYGIPGPRAIPTSKTRPRLCKEGVAVAHVRRATRPLPSGLVLQVNMLIGTTNDGIIEGRLLQYT
jgi:hypothetical protein